MRVCLCGACSGGFRVALVYTVHMTMATGVTTSGREIAWDMGVVEAQPSGALEKTP